MSLDQQPSLPAYSKLLQNLPHNVIALLEKLLPLLPKEEHPALLQELQVPLRPALRLNPLKHKKNENLPENLEQRYGWKFSPIPFCGDGYWQELQNDISLGQTWEHRLGRYYVQDASSMLPVELFDLDSIDQPLMLDMAASPGGKTTHLISKTMDNGLVIANDASRDRIQALRVVLQNWGGLRQAITQFQGERFGQWFPNTFDAILLDAPCSMQNLRPTDARPMRSVSDKEERNLAKRQCKLLESALFAAKPGGQIVYATCTLSPEEDEAVLDWLISRYPDSVQIEDLTQKTGIHSPGITTYGSQTFHSAISKAFRLWPNRINSAGFFCVRLTKIGDIHGKLRTMPTFDIGKTNFHPLEAQLFDPLLELFHQLTIDIIADYLKMGMSLWQRDNTIFLFPDCYFHQIGYLPLRSLGLPIAQISHEGILPDHYFLARAFYENGLPSTIIDPELAEEWQNGRDIPMPTKNSMQICQSTLGEFLGYGIQVGHRLKNMLPRRMIF